MKIYYNKSFEYRHKKKKGEAGFTHDHKKRRGRIGPDPYDFCLNNENEEIEFTRDHKRRRGRIGPYPDEFCLESENTHDEYIIITNCDHHKQRGRISSSHRKRRGGTAPNRALFIFKIK